MGSKCATEMADGRWCENARKGEREREKRFLKKRVLGEEEGERGTSSRANLQRLIPLVDDTALHARVKETRLTSRGRGVGGKRERVRAREGGVVEGFFFLNS